MCTRCGVAKASTEFQIRRASHDGLTAACKACLKAYDDARVNLRHRALARTAYQASETGRKAHQRANAAYRQRRKDRQRAHNAVAKAIARGKLQPWPACAVPDCGAPNPEAHHPDYSRPLDVVWLCDPCHKGAHRTARLLSRLVQPETTAAP